MTVSEHSFDETLLPPKAVIMDAGCGDFTFTDFFKGHKVYSIDIMKLDRKHYQCAIGKSGFVGIEYKEDKQATKVKQGDEIPSFTIQEFAKKHRVKYFDLIKLDIEGSEYDAIMQLDRPLAKQISIEFHLHTGAYTQKEVDEMVDKLKSLGYNVVQHELTDRHCAGFNYWDSLFIL